MNWERIRRQLEQLYQTEVKLEKIAITVWPKADTSELTRMMTMDQKTFFYLQQDGGTVHALSLATQALSGKEKELIGAMLDVLRTDRPNKPLPVFQMDEEAKALQVRDWVQSHLMMGTTTAEMPEAFASYSAMFVSKIPLLLYGDYPDNKKASYLELKKLLESFFEAEVLLIPLQDKEWLILGPESLLMRDGEEDELPEQERTEEGLASICSGLHEMMASEWIGECHLAISYPMVPAKSLLASVMELREAISIGRTYHVGSNIHLPWLHYLDKLLNVIPEADKALFVQNVLKRLDHFTDAEMFKTLEQFFELDCNVSETAKKLYIHRNTLLYRLDRFKQETGLDVRSFSHAVLVKIALLLYKVMKRK